MLDIAGARGGWFETLKKLQVLRRLCRLIALYAETVPVSKQRLAVLLKSEMKLVFISDHVAVFNFT